MTLKSLQNTFLGSKNHKMLQRDIHLKEAEKMFYNCKFSKANALKRPRMRNMFSLIKLKRTLSQFGSYVSLYNPPELSV